MSDTYHSDYSSVSRTMLNLFRQSRLEYYLTYVARELPPKQPTAPMLKGTVLHAILLEGRTLDDLVLCYPSDCLNAKGGLIGARAEEYRESHPGCVCVKYSEYDDLAATVKSVLSRGDIGEVLEQATSKETRVDAVLDGVPCKCKPDIACDLGPSIIAYDLKFSEDVHPEAWRRTSKRLALWMQDAHYSRVLAAAFGKPVQFRFWNIEIKPPYRVLPRWYPAAAREMAFAEHRAKLLDLKACYDSGEWSDDWNSETELSPWDLKSNDDLVEVQ